MKKILLLIIFLFPIFIKAEQCNYQLQQDSVKLSYNITYEKTFDKINKIFDVKFYNVYSGLYIIYDNNIYNPNSNYEVTINSIKEGTYVRASIYAKIGECRAFLRTLNINLGYYNEYYNSEKCYEYRDKLNICNSEYLPYKPNEDLLNKAIDNYKKAYTDKEKKDEKPKEVKNENKVLQAIQNFVDEWGVVIILSIVFSLITTAIFRNVFRKIKHGI